MSEIADWIWKIIIIKAFYYYPTLCRRLDTKNIIIKAAAGMELQQLQMDWKANNCPQTFYKDFQTLLAEPEDIFYLKTDTFNSAISILVKWQTLFCMRIFSKDSQLSLLEEQWIKWVN